MRKLMESTRALFESTLYVHDGDHTYELDTNDQVAMQQFNNRYGFHADSLYDVPVENGVQKFQGPEGVVCVSHDPQSLAAEVERMSEGLADMDMKITGYGKVDPNFSDHPGYPILIQSPGGKRYRFKNKEDMNQLFRGKADKILAGMTNFTVLRNEFEESFIDEGQVKNMLWDKAEKMSRADFIDNATELGMTPQEAKEWWDEINDPDEFEEGYTVMPGFDRERYTELDGLEGPFQAKNGAVYYYDPREGKYYDRDKDMYIDDEEFRAMNESGEQYMDNSWSSMGVPQDTSATYTQTTQDGDRNVTITASGKDMQDIHDMLHLAGLEPMDNTYVPDEVEPASVEVDMMDPDSRTTNSDEYIDTLDLDPSYTTDKEKILSSFRKKMRS